MIAECRLTLSAALRRAPERTASSPHGSPSIGMAHSVRWKSAASVAASASDASSPWRRLVLHGLVAVQDAGRQTAMLLQHLHRLIHGPEHGQAGTLGTGRRDVPTELVIGVKGRSPGSRPPPTR